MLDPFVFLTPLILLPIASLIRFVGCASFDSAEGPTYTLDPAAPALDPGQDVQFKMKMDGKEIPADWTQNAPSGHYIAADPWAGAATATVTGTAKGGTATASATVTLNEFSIVIKPETQDARPGETVTFTSNVPVNWSPPAAGPANPLQYSYTGPVPFVPGSGPVAITATSVAHPGTAKKVSVTLIGNGAAFISKDVTTQGNWRATMAGVPAPYGKKGWLLAVDPTEPVHPANVSSPPAYLSGMINKPPTLPAAPGLNPAPAAEMRALLKPPPGTERFMAFWFDGNTSPFSFSIELDFSDYAAHRVSLYCVDWISSGGGLGRTQKIEVFDADIADIPGAVALNTQNLSNFQNGVYLTWNTAGKIRIKVSNTGNTNTTNCVLSGIFFD